MEINIKYTEIEPSEAIKTYVNKKISSLEKLVKGIERHKPENEEVVQAWVEVGKTTRHHKEGKVWYAECQMRFPGQSFRATSTNYEMNQAIDEMTCKMEELIREYKDKQESRRKRQAA